MDEFLVFLLLVCLIVFLLLLKKEEPIIEKKNYIKQPHYYLYVGVMGLIGFNLGSLIALFDGFEYIPAIICFVISLLYIFAILFERNWRVDFDEKGFNFTNMWKVKKYYLYEEIEYRDTGRVIKIYVNNKRIVAFGWFQVNVDEFDKQYNRYLKNKKKK